MSTLQANTIWICLQISFLFDYIFGSFCSNETFFHCVKLRIYDEIVNKKTAANNNREMIQRETRMWHPGEFQVKVSSITSNIIQQHNTVNSHQYISKIILINGYHLKLNLLNPAGSFLSTALIPHYSQKF